MQEEGKKEKKGLRVAEEKNEINERVHGLSTSMIGLTYNHVQY